MELSSSRSIKESGYGRIPPQWGPVKHAKGTGPSRGIGCGIAPNWSDGTWRPGRWTRHQCFNSWTASEKGVPRWHQPMWLPRTSSTGRRWWMQGKSWVRPTPGSAQWLARFQRGDRRRGEPTQATFDDLPSSEALFNRGTCRRWRKRSSSPCSPRARKRQQPEDVYPPSRQWLPWGGSPPYNGTGYGGSPRPRLIPRRNDSSGGPISSSLWPNRAPEWGSGKYTQQQSCHSPRYAGWGKYRRFDDRTSPRWGLRTRESKETTAISHVAWDRARTHGLHGSAGSPLVRHQHWGVHQTFKWVWPSSCRAQKEERAHGMLGGDQALHTSVGWDCRGDASCGGVDGIASKLRTYARLPPTNLNVCRLHDCLGQPMKESDGEKLISETCGRPASWNSLKMTRQSGSHRPRSRGRGQSEEMVRQRRTKPQE